MTEKKFSKLTDICNIGFTAYSGIQILKVQEGYAEGEVDITAHHLNPHGTVHGGLLFVLTDTIGGLSTRTKDGFVPTTANASIHYLRPTAGTKKLTAKATVIKFGRRLSVVRTDVFDENGTLIATATSDYANIGHKISQ